MYAGGDIFTKNLNDKKVSLFFSNETFFMMFISNLKWLIDIRLVQIQRVQHLYKGLLRIFGEILLAYKCC